MSSLSKVLGLSEWTSFLVTNYYVINQKKCKTSVQTLDQLISSIIPTINHYTTAACLTYVTRRLHTTQLTKLGWELADVLFRQQFSHNYHHHPQHSTPINTHWQHQDAPKKFISHQLVLRALNTMYSSIFLVVMLLFQTTNNIFSLFLGYSYSSTMMTHDAWPQPPPYSNGMWGAHSGLGNPCHVMHVFQCQPLLTRVEGLGAPQHNVN